MKNQYFTSMRQKGIAYRKNVSKLNDTKNSSKYIFSAGESMAFKYWAIAENYSSTDIIVDELPPNENLADFIQTYRFAGITTLVLVNSTKEHLELLKEQNCCIAGPCKVFRQETKLYQGKLEIVRGTRILLSQ